MALSLESIRAQLSPEEPLFGPLGMDEYQRFALCTDRTTSHIARGSSLLLLGLFGEVGGLLSEMKKKQKDQHTFRSYEDSALEEVGDVLWYLAVLAHRVGLSLSQIAAQAAPGHVGPSSDFIAIQPQAMMFAEPAVGLRPEKRLLGLAALTGRLAEHWGPEGLPKADPGLEQAFVAMFKALVEAAEDGQLSLQDAALRNLQKILARHPVIEDWGSPYDADCDEDERLPRRMEVLFKEKKGGGKPYVLQQWNGLNVGDRLTDNSSSNDHYRYHDIFHLSYAAFLGWSPVLRALLKVKRKSDPKADEEQDGARAIITEEGISNWIFSHGLRHNAFAHVHSLEFPLLSTIAQMVKGYEVETRPLWVWERAILEGFRVFRHLRDNGGGLVVADLENHTLTYQKSK